MDGRALAWKWPSALASRTLPCGPCPHDPTGVDSRPSVRPRPCGPRPASSLSGGTVPGVGLISKSLCRRLVFPAATVGGAHGGPSPGPLIVHWPNPAPAQGPSRPPPCSSHTGLLQSPLGQAIPSSLRPSRCPDSGTARRWGCSGSPRGPAPALLVIRPHHCPVSCMRTEPCPSWSFRTPSPAATRDMGWVCSPRF